MNQFNSLRALARSTHWQIVYSRSKEMAQIGLFKNQNDYTPLQIAFLQWLELYHSLEVDLSSKKPYISREIIEDDIRVDAYLHWRDSHSDKTDKEISEEKNNDELHDGAVVFKRRRSKLCPIQPKDS